MADYYYGLGGNLYINLTNRCNNSCAFCIKYRSRKFEGSFDLWLEKEPSAQEVIGSLPDVSGYGQVVFCGYGEPLIRLEAVKEIAKYLKEKGANVRIDTDGQANFFHGRNIVPELAALVDEVNISLNAQDADTYIKLCRPVFGKASYRAVLDFSAKAKEIIPKVVLTAVALPGVDADKCRKIAEDIGVEFRLRPYYEEKYAP